MGGSWEEAGGGPLAQSGKVAGCLWEYKVNNLPHGPALLLHHVHSLSLLHSAPSSHCIVSVFVFLLVPLEEILLSQTLLSSPPLFPASPDPESPLLWLHHHAFDAPRP